MVNSVSGPAVSPWAPETPTPKNRAAEPADAEARAAALVAAFDRDGDGVLTKDEFRSGAFAVLRPGHRRRHDEERIARAETDATPRSVAHESRRAHRLERRLARAFDRVDADGSGDLSVAEVSAILARAARRAGQTTEPPAENAPPASNVEPPPSAAPIPAPSSNDPNETDAPSTPATGSARYQVTVSWTMSVTYSFAVQRYQAAAAAGA